MLREIEVHYQLIDEWESYKPFDTLEDAKQWLKSIGEEMFVYVTVEAVTGVDSEFVYIDGYWEIIDYV